MRFDGPHNTPPSTVLFRISRTRSAPINGSDRWLRIVPQGWVVCGQRTWAESYSILIPSLCFSWISLHRTLSLKAQQIRGLLTQPVPIEDMCIDHGWASIACAKGRLTERDQAALEELANSYFAPARLHPFCFLSPMHNLKAVLINEMALMLSVHGLTPPLPDAEHAQ